MRHNAGTTPCRPRFNRTDSSGTIGCHDRVRRSERHATGGSGGGKFESSDIADLLGWNHSRSHVRPVRHDCACVTPLPSDRSWDVRSAAVWSWSNRHPATKRRRHPVPNHPVRHHRVRRHRVRHHRVRHHRTPRRPRWARPRRVTQPRPLHPCRRLRPTHRVPRANSSSNKMPPRRPTTRHPPNPPPNPAVRNPHELLEVNRPSRPAQHPRRRWNQSMATRRIALGRVGCSGR